MKRICVLFILSATFVGAAGASVSPSISLNQAAPSYGSAVTFSTVLPAANPHETFWVRNSCDQGGVEVYSDVRSPGSVFTLGPTLSWTGGAADCHGVLWSAKNGTLDKVLASTDYHVAG